MKKIALLCPFFMTLITAFSQEMVSQNRAVSNFTAVHISSGIDLILKQSNVEKLVIIADDDKINKIITEVSNGVLNIRFERPQNGWGWNWNNYRNKNSPKVELTFKDMNKILAGGGSDIYSDGRLLFDKIELDARGGSDLKLELTAYAVDCKTSGGSDVYLSGSTKYFIGTASGGSVLKAKDLRSQSAKINSSGGSDAYVWAENDLLANASGGSDIYYYGSPKLLKTHKSGGSDINRR